MKFKSFGVVKKTNIDLTSINLGDLYCGLFRCPLVLAESYIPELKELYDSAPVENKEEWELDLKIHMLMKDQYPCIPNWHCDNVPRVEGETRYDLIKEGTPSMYLWLSDNPTTQFLNQEYLWEFEDVTSHDVLAKKIMEHKDNIERNVFKSAPPQTWISIDQTTPHRGTIALENGWRVFARLTHKSITPVRPVNNYIRRHCQVYLNANTFSW